MSYYCNPSSFKKDDTWDYYPKPTDTIILQGFIVITRPGGRFIFNLKRLPSISQTNGSNTIVCNSIIKLLRRFPISYDAVEQIIDCFQYVVSKGCYPINYKISYTNKRFIRNEIVTDTGIIVGIYEDIYTVLLLCRYDREPIWQFIKLYIGLLDRGDLDIVNALVKTIIIIADARPNDNIKTLIEIVHSIIALDYHYYDLLFELYADGNLISKSTIYIDDTHITRLFEIGIKLNVKMSNDTVQYINGSYYNILVQLTDLRHIIMLSFLLLDKRPQKNDKDIAALNLTVNQLTWDTNYTTHYINNLLNCVNIDSTINDIINVCRYNNNFHNYTAIKSKHMNILQYDEFTNSLITSSIDYNDYDNNGDYISSSVNDRYELFIRIVAKYNTYINKIYKAILAGFRLNIPINDNTLYLYKNIGEHVIINHKEWRDTHDRINKRSNTIKLAFIIRCKLKNPTRVNVNFASIADKVAEYL